MRNAYQPNTYRAPGRGDVPEPVRPYVDAINDARDKWRDATDRAALARQRLTVEPAAAMAAAVAAVADGRETPPPVDRATLEYECEVAEAALAECAHRVRVAWHEAALFLISDAARVLPLADAPAEAASRVVADAEAHLAAARHRLADALGVRQWLSAMSQPRTDRAILSATNGPLPRPGVTLHQIRKAEATWLSDTPATEAHADNAEVIDTANDDAEVIDAPPEPVVIDVPGNVLVLAADVTADDAPPEIEGDAPEVIEGDDDANDAPLVIEGDAPEVTKVTHRRSKATTPTTRYPKAKTPTTRWRSKATTPTTR